MSCRRVNPEIFRRRAGELFDRAEDELSSIRKLCKVMAHTSLEKEAELERLEMRSQELRTTYQTLAEPSQDTVDIVGRFGVETAAMRKALQTEAYDHQVWVADKLRSAKMTTKEGSVIISYSTVRIDQGGFGEILLGQHETFGKLALKCTTRKNKDNERRFHREKANWMSQVHPHVLPFYGECVINGNDYLVSPYASHGNVRDFIARHEPSEVIRAQMLYQLASSLAHIHSEIHDDHGTVLKLPLAHGDLKPDNVLVAGTVAEPHIYLCDFGLSKLLDEATSKGSKGSGLAAYMSPERMFWDDDNAKTRTPQDDIYAFGICISEILSGSLPYGFSVPDSRIYPRVAKGERPRYGDSPVWEVAKRCWLAHPDARPTAEQVFEWLGDILQENTPKLPPLPPSPYILAGRFS